MEVTAADHINSSSPYNAVSPNGLSTWETTDPSAIPWDARDSIPTLPKSILLGMVLSSLAFATIVGNILVILSVCFDRHLHSPPNILIVNLAVADLLVGMIVMPFGIADLVGRPWVWFKWKCDIYVSSDVFSCTASIVTLCMISVDRYMAITRPFKYAPKRTPRLMVGMVLVVWVIGAFIAISPFLWGGHFIGGPGDNICLPSQETVYTIYSTFGAFYLPLIVMLIVYYKIYRAAKLSQELELQRRPSMIPHPPITSRRDSAFSDSTTSSSSSDERRRSLFKFAEYMMNKARPSKSRISLRGERKAAKTLGVIMGAFTICWLPFFLLALIRPFCSCEIPALMDYILLWLGYTNSAINPVIYPLFNKDFGPAYKRLLSCEFIRECEYFQRRRPLYDRGRSGSHPHKIIVDSNVNGKQTNGCCDHCGHLAASDLLNSNVIDRRPIELCKISEASEEPVEP